MDNSYSSLNQGSLSSGCMSLYSCRQEGAAAFKVRVENRKDRWRQRGEATGSKDRHPPEVGPAGHPSETGHAEELRDADDFLCLFTRILFLSISISFFLSFPSCAGLTCMRVYQRLYDLHSNQGADNYHST